MDRKHFENHVVILGWLHLGVGALFAVMAFFVFIFFTGIGVVADDPQAAPILATVGVSVALLLLVFSVPGLLAGYGLLQHLAWARILAIVVGFLQLVNFPFGTAIGAYTLWILFDEQASKVFPLAGSGAEEASD